MARVSVTVLFRSHTPVQIRSGVMDYTWTKSDPLPGTVLNSGISLNDSQTVNQEWAPITQVSIVMSNDKTDRLNRIALIEYLGTLYEVSSVVIDRPEVRLTLGGTANRSMSTYLAIKPMEEGA